MIKIKIEGADVLQKKLKEYGKAVNKESGEIIEDIAVSGAKYLANNTRPFGVSGKTKDTLTKAVYKDVWKAYTPSAETDNTDSGEHMEKFRNRNGRITKAEKMFVSVTNFEEIKKIKTQNVGDAKEGWFDAVATLKNKSKVPAWLRKPLNLGRSTKNGLGFQTTISVINTCKYAYKLLSSSDIQKSLGLAYKNYVKFIDRKMKAMTKKL